MRIHRRRERFKFTEKTHSKRGITVCGFSLALIVLYVVFVMLSYSSEGNLSACFGSAGVAAMVLSLCMVGLAVTSLREENSFVLFPRLALFCSLLSVLCWGGTYISGFMIP